MSSEIIRPSNRIGFYQPEKSTTRTLITAAIESYRQKQKDAQRAKERQEIGARVKARSDARRQGR